ncbi:MAG: SH3 domain-containing protein [Lachnospiraceae bacterium]|nr:SH3 domain-containing protein [Lachnospiraceae bacterium]
MNKYGVKAAACALVGTLSLSGYQMTLEAKIHNSSDVPAAGVAVVLDEGSTIQDLQVEVVQNIAYLESASGLQPNIIKASEKVALADTPSNIVRSNTNAATAKISTEFTEALSESISEVETEILTVEGEAQQEQETEFSTELRTEWELPKQETSGEEESNSEASNEETAEENTLPQETTEEESSTEESSEYETSGEETGETETIDTETTETETTDVETSTEETTETEDRSEETDDFQVSAGFSATDTYDNIEIEEKTASAEETQEDAQDFSGLVIAQVTNYVNVRSTPSEDGEIVGKLYDKSVGEFIEEKDGWYKIVSGNCTGYVKGEFCAAGKQAEELAKEVGTTYAVVNTTTLKVRQDATTESAVLGLVPINEELVVLEELDGWVKIAIEEGDGYVSKDYINLRTDFVHAESREEEEVRLAKEARAREEARAAAAATETARIQRQAEAQAQRSAANQATIESARSIAASSEGSEMGKSVIDYATQFVGNPYVWGGSSLTNGTDCSGFVMSVYSNFGVSLPHSSSALRSQGYDVGGLSNAQPGDIVCYSGHVGLYVGNGQIVHASTSKTGIIVSSATYRNVLSVRRIF